MRICAGLLCDNAADLWWHREAWCGACANQRFGASVGVIAALELRDPPSTRPDGAGRPTRPHDREAGVPLKVTPFLAPAPDHLSGDELLQVLERDGWHDVELEWFTRTGGTLPELERFLMAHLDERTEP